MLSVLVFMAVSQSVCYLLFTQFLMSTYLLSTYLSIFLPSSHRCSMRFSMAVSCVVAGLTLLAGPAASLKCFRCSNDCDESPGKPVECPGSYDTCLVSAAGVEWAKGVYKGDLDKMLSFHGAHVRIPARAVANHPTQLFFLPIRASY